MQTEQTSIPSETDFLAQIRALVLRGDLASAGQAAAEALRRYPASIELRRALAGIHRQTGYAEQAEALLRALLADQPDDFAAAFTLAEMLRDAGRLCAAAVVLHDCFARSSQDTELSIRAIDLLADCGRIVDASNIVETAISASPEDTRLHAYAGMLDIQLGEFARAREHYRYAFDHDPMACEWFVPEGLATAQRYSDSDHPDFALFAQCLKREDLSDKARCSLLFAVAKAHDDIGDFPQAVTYLRRANALAHQSTRWSRKIWRRAVQSRLEAGPYPHRLEANDEFIPVFIVGMPRSGTTLIAELLARHPHVRNRGELPWLPKLAQIPEMAGNPSRERLRQVAAIYRAQSRQDDAPARWYVDKQPLNFRYVGLMLALWPNARILHCRRNPRDTALSLWMQPFVEDVQGYAHDFADIAVVMRDCDRLMVHWRKAHAESIRTLDYERLVSEPDQMLSELGAWLGLPVDAHAGVASPTSPISTASLWQARQPVYTRSVGRWRNYVELVPELMKFEETLPAISG